MGYPTSIFSPAARSNGQTIDASHINDLQVEETAVQTALLGNITHSVNITGASTFATVQAGASTLTSLQVTGNSTFAIAPDFPPPASVRVQSSVVELTNNTTQAISWLHQNFAVNSSIHSTSVNPERFTPQSTGVYEIAVGVETAAGPTGTTGGMRLLIMDSSGVTIARSVFSAVGPFAFGGVTVGVKRFDVAGSTQWVRAEVTVRETSTHSLSTGSWASFTKL